MFADMAVFRRRYYRSGSSHVTDETRNTAEDFGAAGTGTVAVIPLNSRNETNVHKPNAWQMLGLELKLCTAWYTETALLLL